MHLFCTLHWQHRCSPTATPAHSAAAAAAVQVTAPAWPAHPKWLAAFVDVLGYCVVGAAARASLPKLKGSEARWEGEPADARVAIRVPAACFAPAIAASSSHRGCLTALLLCHP